MPMQQPIETYEQFDVVVPFPFTDVAATKRRPALVISDAKNFNSAQKQHVMAMITSQANAGWLLDVLIKDLAASCEQPKCCPHEAVYTRYCFGSEKDWNFRRSRSSSSAISFAKFIKTLTRVKICPLIY